MKNSVAEIHIGRKTYLLLPASAEAEGMATGERAVVGEMRIGDANYMVIDPHAAEPPAQNANRAAQLLTSRELQIAMLVAQGLMNS